MTLGLLIQQFETGNKSGVMMMRVRGFGNWMETGRMKLEETGMGREIVIQTGIEMGISEKTVEMGTQLAMVMEIRRGICRDLESLVVTGFLLVRRTGIPM